MDYLLKNPIQHEGETYDIALFYLSSAPVIIGSDYTTAVNCQIVPARRTDDDVIQLHSHSIKVELTPDIRNAPSSHALLQGYGQISAVIVGLSQQMGIVKV